MAAVFELPDMGPTHRLIMLALADHADDAGRCYPSLDRLAKRTGLSLRAVRSNLRQLEADGQIRTDPQGGPKGCNLYYVTPQPRQEMPPAGDAPGISRRKPRQEMPPPPRQEVPPNHHITIKNHHCSFWSSCRAAISARAEAERRERSRLSAEKAEVMMMWFGMSTCPARSRA